MIKCGLSTQIESGKDNAKHKQIIQVCMPLNVCEKGSRKYVKSCCKMQINCAGLFTLTSVYFVILIFTKWGCTPVWKITDSYHRCIFTQTWLVLKKSKGSTLNFMQWFDWNLSCRSKTKLHVIRNIQWREYKKLTWVLFIAASNIINWDEYKINLVSEKLEGFYATSFCYF